MSDTLTRSFELPEPLKLRRSDDGEADTVEGWIVPFSKVADVVDVTPDGVRRYREGFLPGSLSRMEQGAARRGNASFMRLTLDHDTGLSSRVGWGLSLEQRSEGGYARFKLYRSQNLELVRAMIEETHRGFSVEFEDVAPPRIVDGVTWRRQVNVSAVTLTTDPAYAGAGVVALRDDGDRFETPALDATRAYLDGLDA